MTALTLNVALLQLCCISQDLEASLHKGDAACREAKRLGADIALFPEMWSNGYLFFGDSRPGAREGWTATAIDHQHVYFRHFQSLARELDMAIVLSYLERRGDNLHDSAALTYSKVHTLDYDPTEMTCTPGDDFLVCDLDTAVGLVRVGLLICFDLFFPESARSLMLQDAEIILAPNADGMNDDKVAVFRTRAYENMIGLAACNGRSVAFDGVAYRDGVCRSGASFPLDTLDPSVLISNSGVSTVKT